MCGRMCVMLWILIFCKVLTLRVIMAVSLFYYTSKENFECIHHVGLIWTSNGVAGYGVYLTERPPVSGRMTIANHLYKDHQNKYAMTEVCLETDSSIIPAEKLIAFPEDYIWMASTQLGLAAFSNCYIASPDSLWKRTEVKQFIRKEHMTLNPYTKSPVSQLQEFVIRSGIKPEYSDGFDGTKYVCTVSVASKTGEGIGSSKQVARSEAAKSLLRSLILGMGVSSTKETRHVHLNEENEIIISVNLKEEETSLCNKLEDMHIRENHHDIYRNPELYVSASNNELSKLSATTEMSSENENTSSSLASGIKDNPVGKLQEFCASKGLPQPIYDMVPLARNTELNNFTMAVKVGDFVSEGSGWTKKLAKKAAADDMLHKLGMFSFDELAGHERESTNAPMLIADTTKVQSNYGSSQEPSNPIGRLQEFCVSQGWPLPDYSDVNESGAAHAKTFTVQCSLRGSSQYGIGSSKKNAKHDAALKMWRTITRSFDY